MVLVNQANNGMNTPLHYAVTAGHTEIVELLIKHGAYIDARNFASLWPYVSEDVAKLVIEHMDVSDRPYLLESLKLLKAKDCDEQVRMWCESKVLRDYYIEPEVWREKYPDLVNELTNIANMVMKEIFLRNNRHWKYLINRSLPLGDMQKDLEEKIQREINEKSEVALPPATEFINTNTDILQPPRLQTLMWLKLFKQQAACTLTHKVERVNSGLYIGSCVAGSAGLTVTSYLIGAITLTSWYTVVGPLVGAAVGYGIAKFYEKNEEKKSNPDPKLKNVLTPQCLQYSKLGNVVLERYELGL